MIKIEKIEIQNFYGYRNEIIDFTKYRNEIVLIEGINGVGKSTIFEAIIYALTGQTIRKSKKDSFVNFQQNKNCTVNLVFRKTDNGGSVQFTIIRGRKPSLLKFYSENAEYTESDAISTQHNIEKILGIDYKTIMSSLVFGQHSTIDFLEASPDSKREIIKNFLSLEDLFELRDCIRDFKSTYNQEAKISKTLIEESNKDYNIVVSELNKVNEAKKGFSKYKKFENFSIEHVQEASSKFKKLELKISELKNKEFSAKTALGSAKHRLDDMLSGKTGICRFCNQELPSVSENDILKQEALVDKLNLVHTDSLVELQKAEESVSLNKPMVDMEEFSTFVEYKILLGKEEDLLKRKEELKQKISEYSSKESKSLKNYQIMRFWEKAFSEQGLIKYVIRNILDFFNEKCNYYLSYLSNGKFNIVFDDTFEERIFVNDEETAYISLSGGEKRRVNLAVLLALQSLLSVTKDAPTDVIFFDEIGENLDREGVEGLYNLLQELKVNKTVFLITHDNYLKSKLDSCKQILVVKEEGISKISKGG